MAASGDDIRARIRDQMPRVRTDLAELVSFKSVADEDAYPRAECEGAARWVVEAFAGAGLGDVDTYDTPDGSQAVFGQAAGPDGAPTVLLYCHYDVQPPFDESAWETPPWELTERADGRWYGRGAADCKGNLVAHLAALRALGGAGDLPVNVKVIAEGSEEQGTGGLEEFAPDNAEMLRADAIVICDGGNFAAGVPTITTSLRGVANVTFTVRSLSSALHSGMLGGAAPDPLAALVAILATMRDEQGNTTIRGLDNTGAWQGVEYPVEQFRRDAGILDGVDVIGSGSVADMLWARPALTVLGIDCQRVAGSAASILPEVRCRLNLRVPPGTDASDARRKLVEHIEAVAPWNVRLEFEDDSLGAPFAGSTDGPGFAAMSDAMSEAYGRETTTMGMGGAIPLCTVLQRTYPGADIMIVGVEEPRCLIHAPNESVDPAEIEGIALAEALFMQRLGGDGARR